MSALYQSKLGHGYLKSYLYRIGRTSNDRCRCGQRETAEHLLLGCREYTRERQYLQQGLKDQRLTLTLILHTKEGIAHALEYIKKTGIATRKWHLTRNEDGDEEEARTETGGAGAEEAQG